MTTITTRAGKGTPLTTEELDANFTNLNNAKIEVAPGTTGNVLTSNGAAWISAAPTGGGGASVSVGTTPPNTPSEGDLWWNSESGSLFVWYNDGTSSQWVGTAVGAQGATGSTGATGADGVSAYVYIAYASDASGTGFTTTFNASLDYVAIRTTTTPLTPIAGDFTGLWKNYKGAAGSNGSNGVDGDDAYVYIAYASDASGTGFTTTFNASLDYIAVRTTTTPLTPVSGDFTGLWKNYKGATGNTGNTGATGPMGPKSTLISYPTTADTKVVMFYTTGALTVSKIMAVLPQGASTPSCTFKINHGSDVSAAGTAVVTSPAAVTNTTTGTAVTSFNNASISAGSFVWIEVTAVSGTVPALSVTLEF